MRASRTHTKRWIKASTMRQARYAQALQKRADLFDDKFFARVDQRRTSAAGVRLAAIVLQVPMFSLFAVSLLPHNVNSPDLVSVVTIHSLREILLVASALVSLGITFVAYHHDVLTELLAARVDYQSNDDKNCQAMLNISYGLEFFPLPPRSQAKIELGSGYHLLIGVLASLTAISLAMLTLGALFIRYKVLEEIYFVPTFSAGVSMFVICFVVVTDVLGLLVLVLNTGPLLARAKT